VTAAAAAPSTTSGRRIRRDALLDRLARAARVTQISAPAGSGKSVLLRSWIDEAGIEERVGWVSVEREERRDPQRFWLALVGALRGTGAGARLVREVTPEVDGGALVERLLDDLSSLDERLWLVIDDAHELRTKDVLSQLELFLMRAPPELRFVLSARHDLQLGLHRLRLAGELTEIRSRDLRFTLHESHALFETAGIALSDEALRLLVDRTEGWAAGLRLAALSLDEHPDPERFAADFSGSERTVAEYLIAEVLERQPEEVRRLLLRTSVLERVSGPLADALVGAPGSERILHELEQAGAFVTSLDARRSWFRYHQLFADLLQLELRRTAPDELPALHNAAANWFAEHGDPLAAIRHAQAAENWGFAARLLSEHWFALALGGQSATARELLAGFPANVVDVDPELTVLMAGGLAWRSHAEAERHFALASERLSSVPAERRARLRLTLEALRLSLATERVDIASLAEGAQSLLAAAETPDAARLAVGDDLRTIALITLGIGEAWALRSDEADRHLERGIALAQRIERPYLEVVGLAHRAVVASERSAALAIEQSSQAIELAKVHGWADEPVVTVPYLVLAATMVWQARLDEAEQLLERAKLTLRPEIQPAAQLVFSLVRGALELARGRDEIALTAFRAAAQAAEMMAAQHPLAAVTRSFLLLTLVRLGELERAERIYAELDDEEREGDQLRPSLAALRLAQDDPQAATDALAPALSASGLPDFWAVAAFLLEALARDELGDRRAAGEALERALDRAERDRLLWPFLIFAAPEFLERHRRRGSAHGALISEILDVLAGATPAPPPGEADTLREPLTESELRVLRYLPTNLSRREIANELYVTEHTVKAHTGHLYAKLGVHRRSEAVERARALGLLARSSSRLR
jgi:LuxR family maltose regulon positive regulatory protein